MTKLFKLTTHELAAVVRKEYDKLRVVAEQDGIYRSLDKYIFFEENVPNVSINGLYLFADNAGYHYVSIDERGNESHKITDDIFEVCYWVYNSQTSLMSIKFAEKNPSDSRVDHRRLMFKKQLELLGLISENYKKRGEIDIDEILKEAPYDDFASIRVKLFNKYRDEGVPEDEAWELACEAYPLPK